jgi:hypothetical protein
VQRWEDFERLQIGSTIYIPFSPSLGADGTNRTSLYSCSSYSGRSKKEDYDCVVEGTVLSKNKRSRGYNVAYEVVSCEGCDYDSIIYEGRVVGVGEVFEQDMKYLKIFRD